MQESSMLVIKAEALTKDFISQGLVGKRRKRALDNVSFEIYANKIYGVIGASGSGKSTLGMILAGLLDYEGSVVCFGREIRVWRKKDRLGFAKAVQIVFQDPFRSINPFYTIGSFLDEALKLHYPGERKKKRREKAALMLEKMGLNAYLMDRKPRQLSGGQRQRVVLARSLLLKPKVLILDEITSALDSKTQGEIIELVKRIFEERELTIVFITHDLSLAKGICDEVVLMNEGRIEEIGTKNDFFNSPKSEYGKRLLESVI